MNVFHHVHPLLTSPPTRGRIQPVLTHKPFRMFTCLSNFGNVQARGVGCKQGFFGGDFRNFGKESLLNIHALHNTLYN